MAYRPSPVDFPEELAAIPPAERNWDRAATSVNLTLFALAVLIVSLSYARQDVVAGELRELWKPGLGVLGALLVAALFVNNLWRRACFVSRGQFVAIYRRGGGRRIIAQGEITIIQLSTLQTVRLSMVAVPALLVGVIGVPAYLSSADPSLVGAAWFLGVGLVGLGFVVEVVVGRFASTTVKVDSSEYTLRRMP